MMWKNYLLIAVWNFKNRKVFSAINVLGLALGMTSRVVDENNVDAFHEDSDRIYSIYERQYYDNTTEGLRVCYQTKKAAIVEPVKSLRST